MCSEQGSHGNSRKKYEGEVAEFVGGNLLQHRHGDSHVRLWLVDPSPSRCVIRHHRVVTIFHIHAMRCETASHSIARCLLAILGSAEHSP